MFFLFLVIKPPFPRSARRWERSLSLSVFSPTHPTRAAFPLPSQRVSSARRLHRPGDPKIRSEEEAGRPRERKEKEDNENGGPDWLLLGDVARAHVTGVKCPPGSIHERQTIVKALLGSPG